MLEQPITIVAGPRLAAARAESGLARCLALMFDEVDFGLVLLDADGAARLLNRCARQVLDERHPLHLVAGHLHARSRTDMVALATALAAATQRQQRTLLALGDGGARVSVAVLPLGADVLDGGAATMLLLGRRPLGEHAPLQGFARGHALTPAETRVLAALCAGEPPLKIAERQGVRISTVRTQISGLREKTGARSIRALVHLVSGLPPVAAPAARGEPITVGLPRDGLHLPR